jgi:hypothetical protein
MYIVYLKDLKKNLQFFLKNIPNLINTSNVDYEFERKI